MLDTFPTGTLDWRPEPEAWSATDVLEHLVRVERGVLFGISRQVAAGDARRDVGMPSAESQAELREFLLSEGRIEMPASAERFITPQGKPYADLRAEWDALPDRWREALDSVPAELATVGLIRHALAGALTAEGAAGFVTDHARHHLHQLRRILEADGFPTG